MTSELRPLLRMKAERQKRGWTRAELARRCSMSASDVGKIEAGRADPYPTQIAKLSAALDLTSEELLSVMTYDDKIIICCCGKAWVPRKFEGDDAYCPNCNAGPFELPPPDAAQCAETDGGYQCELHTGHRGAHVFFTPEGVVVDATHLADPHELFKLSLLRGK